MKNQENSMTPVTVIRLYLKCRECGFHGNEWILLDGKTGALQCPECNQKRYKRVTPKWVAKDR